MSPETKVISLIPGIFSEVRRQIIHLQRLAGRRLQSTRLRTTEGQIPACSCGRDIFVQVVIWWFDQAVVQAGRKREREREEEREIKREKEISATHHFTWHPHPVTFFWADCTAARSGTVRLPLQSASYCNTPSHLYPSRISPSVSFSVVTAVVFSAVLPVSLLLPLPSARSASSPILRELYLPSLSLSL